MVLSAVFAVDATELETYSLQLEDDDDLMFAFY